MRHVAELGLERERHAEHQQWQMAGAECTEEKAPAPGLLKGWNAQGKLTGNTVIILLSQ